MPTSSHIAPKVQRTYIRTHRLTDGQTDAAPVSAASCPQLEFLLRLLRGLTDESFKSARRRLHSIRCCRRASRVGLANFALVLDGRSHADCDCIL